jgi:hypothetical protein
MCNLDQEDFMQPVLYRSKGDPLKYLAAHIFCEPPPDDLSVEQLCALHEFFHVVLAAGYRLYQVVPADKAAAVIHAKFSGMVGALPPSPNS